MSSSQKSPKRYGEKDKGPALAKDIAYLKAAYTSSIRPHALVAR
jgi:hypothetical protein